MKVFGVVGRFITFEGGEGVGKSTQIKRLAANLRLNSVDVLVTREPGGTPGAEAVRHVLLSGAAKSLGPEAEAMLFAAARIDHVDNVIKPALASGRWVLCDRFSDSTRVYQGASGVAPELLKTLEHVATDGATPHLTIILDVPAEVGMKRALKRARNNGEQDLDRFERDGLELHAQRRIAFLEIAASEPERCVVIGANTTQKKTADAIWAEVNRRFDLPRPEGGETAGATSALLDETIDLVGASR